MQTAHRRMDLIFKSVTLWKASAAQKRLPQVVRYCQIVFVAAYMCRIMLQWQQTAAEAPLT